MAIEPGNPLAIISVRLILYLLADPFQHVIVVEPFEAVANETKDGFPAPWLYAEDHETRDHLMFDSE
jgi:hypothetical protein